MADPSDTPPPETETAELPTDPLTQLELAEALDLQGAGRMGESIEVLERVLAREPENPDALHLLGVARFTQGRREEGVALVERAVKGAPEFGTAVSNLGRMLRMVNRAGDGLALLRRRTAEQPQDPQACRALGSALMAALMLALGLLAGSGTWLLVTLVGLASTLIESLIGASAQQRWGWLSNELVNGLQTAIAALLAMAFS
jgi:tetratricopeptide (TPR) repeat protein